MELVSEKLNVKINGVVHELSYPTVKQIKELEKDKDNINLDNVCSFLNSCGLPAEVVESLQANHMNELIGALVGKQEN